MWKLQHMSRYSPESDPIPQRNNALFYQEGNDTSQALEYLNQLSEESSLQLSTILPNGMENHSGTYKGSTLAESITPENTEGYSVAIYDWRETEDPTTCPNSEIYIAFSDDIPTKDNENTNLGKGAIIQGADEGTATSNLVKLAENYLQNKY